MITIEQFAKRAIHHLKDDKDSVIGITGDEGSGKSTLAILMSMAADPAFDLERNVLYSPKYDEMKNKVTGLPKYSAIIADEAIRALYKLQWQSKLQQYINILYAICRAENKLTFLLMPRFIDFNEFFRQHRIRFWIHIIDPISRTKEEGHAVIFSKSWNPFTEDAWNFKDMKKVIDDYAHLNKLKEVEFSLRHKAYVLSKSRNYVGIIKFTKMPDDVFVRYSALKQEYAMTDLNTPPEEKVSKVELRQRVNIQKLTIALEEAGKSRKEIATIMGISTGRLYQIITGT